MPGSPPSSLAARCLVLRAPLLQRWSGHSACTRRRSRGGRRASEPSPARSPLPAEHDRAVLPHAPFANMVEVVVRPDAPGLPQLVERRLDVAGLVDRTAEDG